MGDTGGVKSRRLPLLQGGPSGGAGPGVWRMGSYLSGGLRRSCCRHCVLDPSSGEADRPGCQPGPSLSLRLCSQLRRTPPPPASPEPPGDPHQGKGSLFRTDSHSANPNGSTEGGAWGHVPTALQVGPGAQSLCCKQPQAPGSRVTPGREREKLAWGGHRQGSVGGAHAVSVGPLSMRQGP